MWQGLDSRQLCVHGQCSVALKLSQPLLLLLVVFCHLIVDTFGIKFCLRGARIMGVLRHAADRWWRWEMGESVTPLVQIWYIVPNRFSTTVWPTAPGRRRRGPVGLGSCLGRAISRLALVVSRTRNKHAGVKCHILKFCGMAQ